MAIQEKVWIVLEISPRTLSSTSSVIRYSWIIFDAIESDLLTARKNKPHTTSLRPILLLFSQLRLQSSLFP
jgi:hypothetical protein